MKEGRGKREGGRGGTGYGVRGTSQRRNLVTTFPLPLNLIPPLPASPSLVYGLHTGVEYVNDVPIVFSDPSRNE